MEFLIKFTAVFFHLLVTGCFVFCWMERFCKSFLLMLESCNTAFLVLLLIFLIELSEIWLSMLMILLSAANLIWPLFCGNSFCLQSPLYRYWKMFLKCSFGKSSLFLWGSTRYCDRLHNFSVTITRYSSVVWV